MSTSIPWLNNTTPSQLESFYQRLEEKLTEEQLTQISGLFTQEAQTLEQFHKTVLCSKYAQDYILRNTEDFCQLLQSGKIKQNLSKNDFTEDLNLDFAEDGQKLDVHLRKYRNQSMLRIIWRDFNRLSTLQQTTQELSELASASIQCALDFHYRAMCEKLGPPQDEEGKEQPFIVIGMGKLGAGELNLSSDIDLIFTYPEKGKTDHPKKSTSNQEFFSQLGKRIISSLDKNTAEGIVFRVDMRLRPYGQSGALVYSFDAIEEYYQTQGREWERYAMVKANIVAHNGDTSHCQRLQDILRSFTYRKYIDFSVIDALRNLKKMITQEVKRRRLEEDVKLGSGGIREIEFIAQVFQLIRGGRDPELQDRRILRILPLLDELHCLPKETVEKLIEAYIFLRNTEHAIQGYNDIQTQQLPFSAEEQQALHVVMGYDDWESFYQALEQHRALVREAFGDLIASNEDEEESKSDSKHWATLWQNHMGKEGAIELFRESGHEDPERSYKTIQELLDWANNSAMHATSRERLDSFVSLLLTKLENQHAASETFNRLVKFIKAVARRSAYLLLLIENPGALTQLLRLSEASPWIADRLAEHPALLDELLDPTSLYHPPETAELASELQRTTLRIPEEDLESQMETLRYFRSAHALRVAASEISEVLPLMKVSDYLTGIAEVIVEYVLQYCWGEMVKKHGYPDGIEREHPNFIILGYGKLGGLELSHGSDLDLVFIHNSKTQGYTNGKRSIDNQTFFTRLGQKIIHFITTNTASGALYEVDMRLRPSGNSGMLVTNINSFTKYQEESAWTWEHQALVRARVITGDAELAEEFNKVRQNILCRERDLQALRDDVVEMRHKMREHLGSDKSDPNTFHLKQDAGGIVDIEFMVQYGVLAWAHSHPALVTFTDNIRILETFERSNLLAAQEVRQLTEAYKAFRAAGHRLTLQQQPSLADASMLIAEREAVSKIWKTLMASD